MNPSGLHFQWRTPHVADRFRMGVSLHSHTMHSRENMAFLPRYAHQIPLVSQEIRRQELRFLSRYGREVDYSRSYWTPPLPALDAFRLESEQIENTLGLPAMVSLTDHDSVEAGLRLWAQEAPVSVEWTVPVAPSFVHLGIHNLPRESAAGWMETFAAWTAAPDEGRLAEILAALAAMPEVLIVFNHPLWDEGLSGAAIHREMVERFLARFGRWLHAFELNGLRPWEENRQVCELAARYGGPVLSGGDRHGREPNANVNLTNATSFSEFVAEIREDRRSEVLFLPQYRESMRLRCAVTMWDTLRDYPEFPQRALWSDRIYYRQDDGREVTLTELWRGAGPGIVRNFIGLLRVLECSQVRLALRRALQERREYAL